MSETSVWITAIVPVAAVLLTTIINNTYNNRTREYQNKHEEKMKNLELANSQRLRTNDEKRSAYTAVLTEVALALQKREEQIEAGKAAGKTSMSIFSADLVTSTARARLLLDPARWEGFDLTVTGFHQSYYGSTSETQKALAKLFADDLSE
jgi:predicted histidine transporter YuiF (NhaC family)